MSRSRGGRDKAPGDAVISLRADAKTGGEVHDAADEGYPTPCSITGLMAGLSGGSLGYVFGFGGYWLGHRLRGAWRASLAEAWTSARTFAVMGGIYAAAGCFARRLRRVEDAWNGAAAGCATGLALGWAGGPASAAQNCALLGAFSFFIDGVAAPARAAEGGGGGGGAGANRRAAGSVAAFLSPALPLLRPCGGWDEGGGGCLARRR